MDTLKKEIEKLPSLRITVEAHGLMAKKALGQNFLLDKNITDKIIRSSLTAQGIADFSSAFCFEIGPGPGGLTRSILEAEPQKLTVVEMDERCISIMSEIKERVKDRLEIINGDALKINFSSFARKKKHIISNLPYNISVPLLINWLKDIKAYQSLTLMFQKEVAERIMSPTNCKDYGRLSVLAQLQSKITPLLTLNPECFTPAPKIWSQVLLFVPQENVLSTDQIKKIEHLTTLAFSQRRKMIRQSLKSIANLEQKCAQIGIQTTYRPEQITPQQFLSLANLL